MTAEKPKLIIRMAELEDARKISALSRKVYGKGENYTTEEVRGQINNFAEGQLVAEYEGKIVGHCATFQISEKTARRAHSWTEITGGGFAARHDPNGQILYGMEVSVDPDYRRLRIGLRFYRVRRELCQHLGLKGIIFGGRMPGYTRRKRKYPDPADYLAAVVDKQFRDPVINFQLNQGFEPIGVLKDYMPSDTPSGGHAVHMFWENPLAAEAKLLTQTPHDRLPQSVRVATVQFQMRKIASQTEFEEQVEYFVDVAADYGADFVTFPELFTLQLLSLEGEKLEPAQAIEKIAEYTDRFKEFMEQLAVSYHINIIGGSHPTRMDNGDIRNIS